MRRRAPSLAAISVMLGGCTFGTLDTLECVDLYRPGMTQAALGVATAGIASESYGFCTDGRIRADALAGWLRSAAFEPTAPEHHFEVPNGWCLNARRTLPANGRAAFDPARSLHQICALGDTAKAYLTGGTLTDIAGQEHAIRSTYELKDRP